MTGDEGGGSDPPGAAEGGLRGLAEGGTRGVAEDRNCEQVLMSDDYRLVNSFSTPPPKTPSSPTPSPISVIVQPLKHFFRVFPSL